MGLADGDLYVSGSILSFQQMKRVYQNFRAATVPSNLQAGALWSDSDDDRLWHQGATELLEVFTEKTTLTFENLLANSGFGVWSQSDASKGLATITYDSGGNTALVVGETLTGNTSGATCKVISYTTATGAWGSGTATGVITVGACSHDFAWVDNETVTGSAAGADAFTVNMPDSAVQVGLVQNGGFATDTDPPPGWTAVNGGSLTTEGAGQVGNCLMVTRGAANNWAEQSMTVEIGKIYKFTGYFKIGTATSGIIRLGTASGGIQYWEKSGLTDVAWTAYSFTFEATTTTLYVSLYCVGAEGNTNYYDEITCYEITPCCTGADTTAFDRWYKDSTLDLYREHDGSNTKDGSFYALKMVPSAAGDFLTFPSVVGIFDNEEFYRQFAGRTVTLGCWIKTSTASHVRLSLRDNDGGAAHTYSSYHTGGGTFEWLEVTRAIASATVDFLAYIWANVAPAVNGDTIVYISQPMLVFGSHIGEGNYQPKQQEVIILEKYITSNLLDNTIDWSSTGAWIDLNIEADSDAKLPKGAKELKIFSTFKDSGSAANVIWLAFRKDTDINYDWMKYINGVPNDNYTGNSDWVGCDENGDIECRITASGANTFDIFYNRYIAIRIN